MILSKVLFIKVDLDSRAGGCRLTSAVIGSSTGCSEECLGFQAQLYFGDTHALIQIQCLTNTIIFFYFAIHSNTSMLPFSWRLFQMFLLGLQPTFERPELPGQTDRRDPVIQKVVKNISRACGELSLVCPTLYSISEFLCSSLYLCLLLNNEEMDCGDNLHPTLIVSS